MKTNRQEKQEFYSDSETVKKYEELRFFKCWWTICTSV